MEGTASASDVNYANTMALYLGAAAKYKFSHVRLMDCIIDLAEIFDTNPNITIPELAEYYGAPVEHMEMFSHLMFEKNHTLMVENTQYLRDIEPTLPHPMFYPAVIPLVVSFTIVGTLVMMARFYSRLSILGRIPFYDWLMLVGFILAETMMAVIIADSYTARNGSSSYDMTWTDLVNDCIFLNIRDVLYPVAALVVKSSLLLFYWRLSPSKTGLLKWVVILTFVVSVGSAVPAAVVNLVYYGRVDWWNHILDPSFSTNGWLNYPVEFMVTGGLNILTDVVIWIIPIVLIWGPMRKRGRPERIATIMLFVLGAIVCVTGALRIATFWELQVEDGSGPLASIPISVWSILEVQLAIICASVPALRALVVKYFPKMLGIRNSIIIGSRRRSRTAGSNIQELDTWNDHDHDGYGGKRRMSSLHSAQGGFHIVTIKAPASSRESRSTIDPIFERDERV